MFAPPLARAACRLSAGAADFASDPAQVAPHDKALAAAARVPLLRGPRSCSHSSMASENPVAENSTARKSRLAHSAGVSDSRSALSRGGSR